MIVNYCKQVYYQAAAQLKVSTNIKALTAEDMLKALYNKPVMYTIKGHSIFEN